MNADLMVSRLAEFGFGAAPVAALLEHQRQIRSALIEFPWTELEPLLQATPPTPTFLIGYGSLLNRDSAARSVRHTPPEGHPPVFALGVRRVFNYRMPESVIQRYGVDAPLPARAALNAEPEASSLINGRLIPFDLEDLPALRQREMAYDLFPVSTLFWDQPELPPFTAYVLCCRHTVWQGTTFVDDTLTPYPPYYDLCRKAAESISPAFLQFYLKTSFLADRRTTAFELEAAADQ